MTQYYDNIYVFGRVNLAFTPTSGTRNRIGDIIELAPGIEATILDEKVSLCHTKRNDTKMCFWEGDCEITIDIEGKKVKINDHDKQNGLKNYFTYNRVTYYVVGHRFKIDDDEITRLRYTVYKDDSNSILMNSSVSNKYHQYETLYNTKEYDDETCKLGELFTIKLHNNFTTGSSIELDPSPGLIIIDKQFDLSCKKVGCGGVMTYTLKGVTRGKKILTIYRGQKWNPETMSIKTLYFEIV